MVAAPGIFHPGNGIQDLVPRPGSIGSPPHWEHGVSATGPPRKSQHLGEFFKMFSYGLQNAQYNETKTLNMTHHHQDCRGNGRKYMRTVVCPDRKEYKIMSDCPLYYH